MNTEQLQALFGERFLGREQINKMLERMGMEPLGEADVPPVNFSEQILKENASTHLLILGYAGKEGAPLNILRFRECFGTDPEKSEPCLYNQDWYLHEDFVLRTLEPRWYLVRKDVFEQSRAVQPDALLKKDIVFPSAILCVYTFFAWYFACGQYLWYHDFVWCSDLDHNSDRIYVGKYHDIDGVNKNGFSIHRHLALRPCYGCISAL